MNRPNAIPTALPLVLWTGLVACTDLQLQDQITEADAGEGTATDGGLATEDFGNSPMGMAGSGARNAKLDPSESREACGNGFDDDEDGEVDEHCVCEPEEMQPCFRGAVDKAGIGACHMGTQRCHAPADRFELEQDTWDACEGEGAASDEVCNSIDDDCDGEVDGLMRPCSSTCGRGMQTCTHGSWSACAAREPVDESCNGVDDDCDGVIDDLSEPCASACGAGVRRCDGGRWSECSAAQPSGEICNGLDDDCDGVVDGIEERCETACGSGVRKCNGSWSSCSATVPTMEQCNGLDDDCDSVADDGLMAPWDFQNTCVSSRIFITVDGCNACQSSCWGHWVEPLGSVEIPIAQNTCFIFSAFARFSDGHEKCLDENQYGDYIGQTREYCNGDCGRQPLPMGVLSGC